MKKYVLIMIVLGILEISLVLYLTFWREIFWNYVSAKNSLEFLIFLGIFTVVALLLCFITSMSTYIGTLAAIKWREKLNLAAHNCNSQVENTNQRIQEDCAVYPQLIVTILYGLLKSITYTIVFAVTLSVTFKISYLLLISIYAILSTLIAHRIGTPLIKLNYMSQQVEATYRNDLTLPKFRECIFVQLNLARKLKHLQYFQSFYGQIGVVIPLLIVAPDYFMTGMLLGGLMQANSLMSTISENLSYGINNFDVFNKLLSCRKRLKEIGVL